MTTHEAVITADGRALLRQIVESEMTDPFAAFQRLYPAKTVQLPGFRKNEILFLDGNDFILACALLEGLTIKTHFIRITENTRFEPSFRSEIPESSRAGSPFDLVPAEQTTFLFNPKLGRVWLFLHFETPKAVWDNSAADVYLLFQYLDQWFRPPLPNLFDDARVCLGTLDERSLTATPSFIERCDNYLAGFADNYWGSDLLTDQKQEYCNLLFGRTGTPCPGAAPVSCAPSDWRPYCFACNPAPLNHILNRIPPCHP